VSDAVFVNLHTGLIEALVRLMEYGACRAENYAFAIEDAKEDGAEVPIEIVNEGLVFIGDLDGRIPTLSKNMRARDARCYVRHAREDINDARLSVAV
jgi:hypothetical protein